MNSRKQVQAEIEYVREDGVKVHSDIEPPGCSPDNMNDPVWRKFIHTCLDEWLDESRGTGCFYIEHEGWERT
jgi:hypothetical protein